MANQKSSINLPYLTIYSKDETVPPNQLVLLDDGTTGIIKKIENKREKNYGKTKNGYGATKRGRAY